MRRVPFFIREALRALRRNAAPSVAAIVTIVVTTLLLGVLIPVLHASASKTSDVRSQIELRVFLYDDASQNQIDTLQNRLKNLPHVTGAQYVGKKQALGILKGRLQNGSDLEKSLNQLKGNPLPRSFNVSIDDPNNLETVKQEIAPPGPN